MNELLQQLKTKCNLSEQAMSSIKSCFGETGLNIFEDLKNKKKIKHSCNVRKFALTLLAYSPI